MLLMGVFAIGGVPGTAAAATPRTWYVGASAPPGGTGTQARPFNSLAQVERASLAGDTILVLSATKPLDGGIQLKRRQRLVGAGGAVTGLSPTSAAPWLTNTGTRLSGDAVRLADGVRVANLRITGTHRGGVYGEDVTGVAVVGNDVAGQNTSCTRGFLIPEFNFPTNVPGVGAPISGGLPNGWAGIMVDGDTRIGATAYISGNRVHDAECGDGIDVRISGTASYSVTIADNKVHGLRQGHDLKSVLAIGTQARDRGVLRARITGNRQWALGNAGELELGPHGADSEGVFINGVGPSLIDVVVERNHYDNTLGNFSANGLEMVTMGSGATARAVVRDSTFRGAPGDLIEEGALGTDTRLDMTLERVLVEESTGVGNTLLVPANNGDCVIAGALGARADVRLTVRDSILRNCKNNGLSLGSNVVNGSGPAANVSATVTGSTITGNQGGNLGIRNFTALDRLSVRVQDTDLSNSKGIGSMVANVSVEELGTTTSSVIDLGGGALGSTGGNCLHGGLLAADVLRYAVSARGSWWGSPGGPGPLRTVVVDGSLDAGAPLGSAPARCG